MSTLSNYSFLPWLRQGIANKITSAENDTNVKLRAAIQVKIQLNAEKLDGSTQTETITRDIQLYGPGDIIGIESRAIIRTEPRNYWITNFEPNYLPYIEFYDEDFPWRYTPAAPDKALHRLRPWIMLVVLKEDEFEDEAKVEGKPWPYIKLKVPASKALPPADDLWAWAHVHVNRSLTASDTEIVSTNKDAFLPKLQSALSENADLAYSRILCPRKLDENVPYHAFLVPSFESGRMAGLGMTLDPNLSANQPAWNSGTPAGLELPYYHRWYFRTGTVGDFEYLVRLLEAKPVDKNVGLRDLDVQYPGANLPGIDDPKLGGILKLGGALRPPKNLLEELLTPEELEEYKKYQEWYTSYPHKFQKALASFINLSSDYAKQTAKEANRTSGLVAEMGNDPENDPKNDPDPLITPPIYGRWHALTERLLTEQDGTDVPNNSNWLHQLNLDPRFRVTAGLGTHVIQEQQEEYMNAAWEQVGDVLEANRRIREAQLAKEVAWVWHERHLRPLYEINLEKALVTTVPMQRRVVTEGFTIHQHFKESVIPPSLISTAMRRVLRPGGRLMRNTFKSEPQPNNPITRVLTAIQRAMRRLMRREKPHPGNLLARINRREIDATPPKTTPPNLPTIEVVSDKMAKIPGNLTPFLVDWLRRYPLLIFVPLVLIVIVALLTLIFAFTVVIVPIGLAIIVGLVQLYRYLNQAKQTLDSIDSIRPDQQTPEAVDRLPHSPDFVLSEPGSSFKPQPGTTDSVEAQRFKICLKDANLLLEASLAAGLEPSYKTLNLAELGKVTQLAIDPERTIPLRTLNSVYLPKHIKDELRETFEEAWAYPQFDTPMYKPLVNISSDLFLPNIQRIEQNSITLLETNQEFIEAYMVGLNHEFARELLWREYPTDQRGSYFRQFWDVSSFLNPDPKLNTDELREKLRDIPAIHRWSPKSRLGDHDQRDQGGKVEEEVVLVIRGELLKKYPTAVIYAHRAKWKTKNDGTIDKTKERQLDPPFDQVDNNPSRDKIKTPLYEAKVEPDIYFFGFDLTAEAVKGETTEKPDDPGWFFVIKERPGEPRFGLDIDKPTELNVWNDLSWKDVLPTEADGIFLKFTKPFSLTKPDDKSEEKDQYDEDTWGENEKVSWDQNTNSAELAYILYQTPVLVAIHAAELLQKV